MFIDGGVDEFVVVVKLYSCLKNKLVCRYKLVGNIFVEVGFEEGVVIVMEMIFIVIFFYLFISMVCLFV